MDKENLRVLVIILVAIVSLIISIFLTELAGLDGPEGAVILFPILIVAVWLVDKVFDWFSD